MGGASYPPAVSWPVLTATASASTATTAMVAPTHGGLTFFFADLRGGGV